MATDLFRYATAATPGARHDLEQLRAVARMLGTPHMPWQDHMARVASEHHPERPNQFRYPIVVCTVPRQAGKTQEFTVVQVDRSIRHRRHRTYTTAQTGINARKLWKEGILSVVDPKTAEELGRPANPRLAKLVRKIDRSAGSPGIRFVNGSFIGPFAPGPKALDGTPKVNLLGVDESFAFTDLTGSELLGSIGPTQNIATWRQLWIFSTKGGRRATWFNNWLTQGRAATSNPDAPIAYFECAAEPDCDPESPDSLRFHPAIGHTTTLAELFADRQKYSLAEWKRAFLNLDAEDGTDAYDLDPDQLGRLAGVQPADMPNLDDCAIAVDLAVDRSAATIVAAWPEPDRPVGQAGHVHATVLASMPGIEWVPDTLTDLTRRGARVILAEPSGPTRTLIADLAARDNPLYINDTSPRDYASGCQWLLDAVAARRIRHDGTATLVDQARDLVCRPAAGVKAFDPQKSRGPIDALRALALATHHAATRPLTIQVF